MKIQMLNKDTNIITVKIPTKKKNTDIINKNISRQRILYKKYFDQLSLEKYRSTHISIKDRIFYQEILNNSIVKRLLSRSNQTIVDVGAGICDLERILQKLIASNQNCKIIAIDRSPNMLRKGLELQTNSPFTLEFIVADVKCCPIPDNIADLTFAINVIPYIEDIKALSHELYRITKPSGFFILIQPEKCKFWEEKFEDIQVIFHNNTQRIFSSIGFQLLEKKFITVYPIPDVKNISMKIASLMVFKGK